MFNEWYGLKSITTSEGGEETVEGDGPPFTLTADATHVSVHFETWQYPGSYDYSPGYWRLWIRIRTDDPELFNYTMIIDGSSNMSGNNFVFIARIEVLNALENNTTYHVDAKFKPSDVGGAPDPPEQ